MPSVRVRSKTYTPVHEVFAQADPGDVAEGSPTEGPANNTPIPRFSLLHDRTGTATLAAPGRPRAMTLSSRVHAHCTLSSGSINSRSPTSPVIPLPSEHLQPAEESNRPVGIRHTTGRAESSINLSHGGSDNFWDSFNPESDHHHDDVVEHLDVIGTYSQSWICFTAYIPIDAQVGAFATLTNAANAIIMFVLFC
jgi:hypothetical protein